MFHNASSTNDPRQLFAVKSYIPRPVASEDLHVDYSRFIVSGVMFRYKICSWLAIIFCSQSLVNMRNFENDLKQIFMAMMFAVMGLVTNYLGSNRSATKK